MRNMQNMTNKDKLSELFYDLRRSHTTTAIDYFIVTKEGVTQYGMYKQALAELHSRYCTLKEMYAKAKLLRIDIEEINSRRPITLDIESNFDAQRDIVKLSQKQFSLEELQKAILDKSEEFVRFWTIAEYLKNKIGEINADKRLELEKEFWIYQLAKQANMSRMQTGKIAQNTLEGIASLPLDMRKSIFALLDRSNLETENKLWTEEQLSVLNGSISLPLEEVKQLVLE